MEEQKIQDKLKSIDHVQTFVIHFFRSETARETALRSRLDVTTGGAVVVVSGLLSLYFTSPDVNHVILLASILVILVFLLIEARRYHVYAIVKHRVRHIEKDYIAPLFNQIALAPKNIDYPPHVDPGLVVSLLENKSPISRFEAFVWRLRSIYIYLFGVIYIVWLNRISRNHTDQPWLEYVNQDAAIGSIPGTVVFLCLQQ
ncbi:DUF2270 domain-containing protein [bacterium]|nr:DUF2270 domain-containing protein [bacterium]